MAGYDNQSEQARKGRIVAIVIAATALFWVAATFIGAEIGLSQRVRALFDLMALGGFVLALAMIYQIWRKRQKNEG
ncbi:MAG: DUF5337 domain-containing protein [Rhodobacteraceae bacterium]|nr:DUF5337 domain-containing protein [Paracoccaceae bacterium]MCW9044299.1 DUF5337 domain-containing protein [Pseudopelagicola sp.]